MIKGFEPRIYQQTILATAVKYNTLVVLPTGMGKTNIFLMLAAQRLTELGGQSAAYFIAMAATLGEPGATVSEFRPMSCNDNCNSALGSAVDRFFWRVNFPHAPANLRPINCNDNCNR